ncbi:MAG: hypothetical protein NC305_04155 [Lachnospiraceae bacterium]|nr:hypothetical protein [Muribaculaceae bacterium]MCM1409725.1 hypothetical protein [Lachnospiraceae bacterium]
MGDTIEKIGRWLKYGVLLSFAPMALMKMLSMIVGYDFDVVDATPDMVLLGFAVAVNALSYETDNEKMINEHARNFFQNISRVIMLVCVALYFGLFNYRILGDEIKKRLEARGDIVSFVGALVLGSVFVNAVFGIVIEWFSTKGAAKKQASAQENGQESGQEQVQLQVHVQGHVQLQVQVQEKTDDVED